jgi:PKD repeat protein
VAIKSLEERGLLRIEGMTAEYGHRRDLLPLISFLLFSSILLLGGCADFLWGTPQATFTCSHSSCYPYQQVEFDASGCISEKDEIVEYSWTFGDGASGGGINPGDYAVSLTITTEHGQEASVTHTIHVSNALVVPALYPTIQAAIDAAKDGDVVVLP